MKRRFSFTGLMLSAVLIASTFALPLPATEGRKLVLVASHQSDAAALSPEEVRKLYLGVAVTKDGKTFLPLCNHTNTVVYEVFMQKVMYMSGPAYERAMMTRVVRTMSSRPPEYSAEKELFRALATNPNAVTYMWADKAEAAGLKVVAELWREK
ncbi:MAG: hypothetical protein NUV55_05605 [Sulfuricaulis sp.]|uniref:hypothetical protein n=1 Tax=Sulfuricaulis sp. TaxID=2003553 RepID=UPI0025E0396A|nr:hypothetical protein [Sulfuricaulis sp.]MCR4346661.1 hypothetical protein [Sulfuricaulis sp.]